MAWKVLRWDYLRSVWRTPFRDVVIDTKILKAKGKLNKNYIENDIESGAIHCFKTKRAADSFRTSSECVFKVIGKGYMADGYNDEIAFKEIEFVENPNDYEWEYGK